jgi:NADPH2:quinone reductase
MRAAYYDAFGGPENVRIGERPDPVPDAQHMLVRTRAAGVGIWDVGILSSTVGRAVPPSIPGGDAPLPRIPGFEIAGTVEVGAAGFGAGDRVFGSLWGLGRGGFAELATLSVERAALMPDRIDFPEAAALVISAGTAYEGIVDRAKLQAGETVLVTAASGGVGSAAVQIARSAGARVVAVAVARSHSYVRDLGAEMVVDYHDPGFIEQLRSAVPKGFDVLFDGTGNEVRDQVLKLVRKGGRAVFIALQGPAPPPADGVEIQSFAAVVNSTRLQAVAGLVAGGRLRMPIDTEFPLERAREAMEHVGARHTQGRAVLRIES